MAKKNRRHQSKKPQRTPPRPGPAPLTTSRAPLTTSGSAPAAPAGAPARVPAQERPLRSRSQAPLSQGAAIPLESVPYFRTDLRRIGLTAVVMFILLVGGALLIH